MATGTTIDLPPLQVNILRIVLVGDTPLIVHKWSDKAKKMMLDKQMKKASAGKEAKGPYQDFLDSLYTLPNNE